VTDYKFPESSIILIIADTTKTLGMLFDYLRGFGFRVLVANEGESGLVIAEVVHPDIILLDVQLPGIDGFETCRRLKANEFTRDIPIIFITALAGAVDKVRGFSLGAVDYIIKPIQSEEVLARLKTHLTIQSLQNELEQQNARLQEEIEEREKLIGELDSFAHTVAHDLKNPLGAMMNYAQFLQLYSTKMSTEELQEYGETIFRNGQRMTNIINELLLLASVRTEEITLQPLDMANIVTEARSRLAYMIEEYQAEITVPDEWPEAWGYAPWVEEIWANYLSNALKYGGEPPCVELGATVQDDGLVRFWIRDNGDGISPEMQSQLFTPFARINQVRAKGHGLGLSIVQRIVEKLSGQVGVESEGLPGQGSVFSFYLTSSQLQQSAEA
jgi:signal transduction histidine kinase